MCDGWKALAIFLMLLIGVGAVSWIIGWCQCKVLEIEQRLHSLEIGEKLIKRSMGIKE